MYEVFLILEFSMTLFWNQYFLQSFFFFEYDLRSIKKILVGWENLAITQSAFTFSKLTIETLEQGVKYVQSSGVFIVNFEHISHLVLVLLLLTLSR